MKNILKEYYYKYDIEAINMVTVDKLMEWPLDTNTIPLTS